MEKNPIIIALDGMERTEAFEMAEKLSGKVWGFKVNDLLDADVGSIAIIKELKKYGKVFADCKFHDIPQTVENRIKKIVRAKPDLITVHASGGIEMMTRAIAVAGESKILAVTVLTSLSDHDANNIFHTSVSTKVLEFVQDASRAAVYGIVCSAQELSLYKNFKNLIKVTPGIRPRWFQDAGDDQKRTATPAEAIGFGSTYLVIGRPITKAKYQIDAIERTLEEIEQRSHHR